MANLNNFDVLSDERLDYVNEKITLIQKKNGLTFGTDAFLLAAYIKENKRARAAELGTGTGIISLLCALLLWFYVLSLVTGFMC